MRDFLSCRFGSTPVMSSNVYGVPWWDYVRSIRVIDVDRNADPVDTKPTVH